ncbi:hypothetical protein U1Q18_040863 [Sarracenia purpurea var. burkii]
MWLCAGLGNANARLPILLSVELFPSASLSRSPPRPLLLFPQASSVSGSSTNPIIHPSYSFPPNPRIIKSRSIAPWTTTPPSSWSSSSQPLLANSHNIDSTILFGCENASDDGGVNYDEEGEGDENDDDIEIEIEKLGKNSRRIRSRIAIKASLQTVWNILTDYEKLADFIPGLAVSQLLEKRGNFVRLFQIGQQKLAFGLNFNAKGIVDCYEKDLESFPFGHRRDIEFKMIEGDFQLFEGKWSIEQYNIGRCEDGDSLGVQKFYTTLLYVVDVEPKLWLPVRLVEGRLSKEIKVNLSCIRVEAQKANHDIPDI